MSWGLRLSNSCITLNKRENVCLLFPRTTWGVRGSELSVGLRWEALPAITRATRCQCWAVEMTLRPHRGSPLSVCLEREIFKRMQSDKIQLADKLFLSTLFRHYHIKHCDEQKMDWRKYRCLLGSEANSKRPSLLKHSWLYKPQVSPCSLSRCKWTESQPPVYDSVFMRSFISREYV